MDVKQQKIRILVGAALFCALLLAVGITVLTGGGKGNGNSKDGQAQSTNHKEPDNPLQGATLYADPYSNASRQAQLWSDTRPDDATLMQQLADQPAAKWLTTTESINKNFQDYLKAAKSAESTAILVAYNIPYRDCGLYSSGGATDLKEYKQYIDKLSQAIGDSDAVIIIEPDSVANLTANKDCLSEKQQDEHTEGLAYAVEQLKSRNTNTAVYLDAGHSAWVADLGRLSEVLRSAGIEYADGFSLNVSNFQTSTDSIAYGKRLSDALGGNKHFVIDTSRNGNGAYKNPKHPDFGWCNPPNRSLGHYPTVDTGQPLVDAYLYIKAPGESDGKDADPDKCFGGPQAGEWWPEYALGLAKRWPEELQP